MGKYTVLDEPWIDEIVENHMQQIVAAIRTQIEPQAIFLRGSFSQGEGSIAFEENKLHFLSDYELGAITPHYKHRRWLQTVAQQMTDKLGVETSIARVHPDNIVHNSLGNIPFKGIAKPTIAMYEAQNVGLTLYGEHMLDRGPVIDPSTLSMWAGVRLLFNRMAESLDYLSQTEKDWDVLHWINKTILACEESLLIAHRQYHYSYRGRGRLFAQLVSQLEPILAQAPELPDLVERAITFKLRPSFDLYPEPVPVIWQRVRHVCDVTFRCVMEKYLGISFNDYAEFPGLYLSQLHLQDKLGKNKFRLVPAPLYHNLFLSAKALRARRHPPLRLLMSKPMQPAYHIALAIVPLIFIHDNDNVLPVARRWLAMLNRLESSYNNKQTELDYLRHCSKQAWKDFCYGL